MCLGFDTLLLVVVIINNNIYNINFILGPDAEGNHTVYGGVSFLGYLAETIPTNR